MSSSNIYLSPLCSCVFCRKVKSAKGIHSHFNISHTKEGKDKHLENAKKSNSKAALSNKNNKFNKNIIKWKEYYSNPKYCINCLSEQDWFRRNNKFCSQTCAAKYTNTHRDKSIYNKQKISLSITLKTKFKSKPKKTKPKKLKYKKTKSEYCKFSYCVVCGVTIRHKYKKTCNVICTKKHLSNLASIKQTHPQNGKLIIYNGIKLGSSYELTMAKSLDDNNIQWVKPKPLKYKDPNNKFRNYFPDFYLPDFDLYLDPKNDFLINHVNPETGFKDTDKIKWAEQENNVRILILNKNQLSWEYIKTIL